MKRQTRKPAVNHGQTALEYLATYGWAIAIILVVLSVAFYEAFDPYQYIPNACTLGNELGCLDYKITDDYVEISLINRLGEDISISGITIPGCNGTATGTLLRSEPNTFRVTGCSLDNSSKYADEIHITYVAKSGIPHNTYGTLSGTVAPSTAVTKTRLFRQNGASVNETNDAQISSDNPNTNYGASNVLTIDEQGPHSHAVIQFPNIIGNSEDQIPPGTQIDSAILRVNCFNSGYMG
ncbi:MAG: hypothetical protein Q8R15_02090, partial [Candidatus Micrarchaeota archaeon]|nr:hypothetical protein [Candidatus Micrarchaeota archaeon]